MLGQQILGTLAKKLGESMRPPSRLCIDPLKKILIKKNFENFFLKKKSKKSSKVEIFTMVKIQNIFRPMFL